MAPNQTYSIQLFQDIPFCQRLVVIGRINITTKPRHAEAADLKNYIITASTIMTVCILIGAFFTLRYVMTSAVVQNGGKINKMAAVAGGMDRSCSHQRNGPLNMNDCNAHYLEFIFLYQLISLLLCIICLSIYNYSTNCTVIYYFLGPSFQVTWERRRQWNRKWWTKCVHNIRTKFSCPVEILSIICLFAQMHYDIWCELYGQKCSC